MTAFADYVRFTVNEHEGKFRLTEFDDSLRAACVAYANSEEARSSGFSATEAEIEEFVDYIDGQVVAVIALPFFPAFIRPFDMFMRSVLLRLPSGLRRRCRSDIRGSLSA